MKLAEREKESMAAFAELDRKERERKEKIERYARYGLDYEEIERKEALRRVKREELEQLLDDYALSIWKAAWMMMAEGYENNEDGIQAFCAAHPQYQMVVRAQAACPENI